MSGRDERLSPRLRWMADQVVIGPVADIGVDHGHLAGVLSSRGLQVIGSDVSAAALARAVGHCQGLTATFRLGDGLDVFHTGEVATVILAGMGGKTICGILERGLARVGPRHLVIQPNRHVVYVRRWLATEGWQITDENITRNGVWHFAMSASMATAPVCLSPSEAAFGPCLSRTQSETWREWASTEKTRLQNLIEHIRLHSGQSSAREELEHQLGMLRAVIPDS